MREEGVLAALRRRRENYIAMSGCRMDTENSIYRKPLSVWL